MLPVATEVHIQRIKATVKGIQTAYFYTCWYPREKGKKQFIKPGQKKDVIFFFLYSPGLNLSWNNWQFLDLLKEMMSEDKYPDVCWPDV